MDYYVKFCIKPTPYQESRVASTISSVWNCVASWTPGKVMAEGRYSLRETAEEFVDSATSAIWRANREPCDVTISMTLIPPESTVYRRCR